MNDTKAMVEYFEKIKNTSRSIRKKGILSDLNRNVNSKNLKRFLQYVYSPYIVYNITLPNKNDLSILGVNFNLPITDVKTLMDKLEFFFIQKKLKGNDGKKVLIDIYQSCDSFTKPLLQMIINRDLNIGINTGIINNVISDCIPTAQYMGAVGFKGFLDLISRSEIKDVSDDSVGLIQAKADGLFAFCNINEKTFISRRLKEILFTDKNIINQINKLLTFGQKAAFLNRKVFFTLHGELTIEGIPDRLKANGIFKALTTLSLKKLEDEVIYKKYRAEFKKVFGISDIEMRKKIRYTVWDMTESGNNINNIHRFNFLKRLIIAFKKENPEIQFFQLIEHDYIKADNFEKIIDFFEDQLLQGNEGAIYKVATAEFTSGHSTDCIKFKNIFDFDLKIVGFEEGKNENTLGALICESEDGLVKTNLSGIDQQLKEDIWKNKEKYLGKIVEGEANDITKSDKNDHYSLMHPRFIIIRDDKDQADTLEKIQLSRKSFNLIYHMRDDLYNALTKVINKEEV